MFSIFKNKKKSKAFISLSFTFFVLVSFVPQQVEAASWAEVGTCLASLVGGVASIGIFGGGCFNVILSYVFYYILTIFSWILGLVGLLFNSVFNITIVHMAENVKGINIIPIGWAAIRDLANILFIFMLLYLAISTILQLDEHGVKHGLSRLIIGAVLINFSLFFVKVPIDLSNILAIKIYNQIQPEGGAKNAKGDASASFGLGDAFMQMFSLQKVFQDPELAALDVNKVNNGQSVPSLKQNPITTFVMGIILMFITAFIFLAVIIILVKRFITLVMLMIFSPLAFAGMAIPSHDVEHQISHDFWNTLVKESFYAPVFMFMIYLTLSVGKALDGNTLVGQPEMAFLGLPVDNIISYTVVMGMMIFSLTVSEKIGVKGASSAIGGFNAMRGATAGWIGSNTVGRVAHTVLNKGDSATNLARWSTSTNPIISGLSRSTQGVLKNVGAGFANKVHADEEAKKALDDELHSDPNNRANMLMSAYNKDGQFNKFGANFQSGEIMAHHWGADEHANVKLELEKIRDDAENAIKKAKAAGDSDTEKIETAKFNKAKAALDRHYTGHHPRLTPEMANKVARAEYGELDYYNNEFRNILKNGSLSDKTAKLDEFIKNAKSEAVVTGAIKSLGKDSGLFEGDTPDAKALREKLTTSLRSKFNSEGFYSNIAKDQIISKDLKVAAASAGYKAKMTVDLYTALTGSKASEAEKYNNGEMVNKFIENMKPLASMEAAMEKYEIDKDWDGLLKAYATNQLGDDKSTHNYFTKDNGQRSQVQSAEILAELDSVKKAVQSVYPPKKDE